MFLQALTNTTARAFSHSRTLAAVATFALTLTLGMVQMSEPAEAIRLYAQQNGNIPCSTCHTRYGLSSGNMYNFTRKGRQFKRYGYLPSPPPVYNPPSYNPPPVYNPPSYNPPPVYNPPSYNPPVYNPPVIRGKLTCNQAIARVRAHGYRSVRAKDCSGGRYTFHARKRGVWYRLRMRAYSGKIYKVTYL